MSRLPLNKKITLFLLVFIFTISIGMVLTLNFYFSFKTKDGYRIKKVFYLCNNYRYTGYLFAPLTKGPYPGIVFCHGNLPTGKDTALYMEMCQQLARKGYLILTFDIKGFGESEEITKIRLPEDLDFITDTEAAIDYFYKLDLTTKNNLTIIGHSSGGNIALAAGTLDSRIKNIICISPGDFNPLLNPYDLQKHYRNRLAKGLEYKMPMDYYHKLVEPLTMENYIDSLSGKNILFVIAEHDHINQKRFAKHIFDEIQNARSKELIEIKNAIHTIGARLVDGNKIEDASKISALTDTINNWLTTKISYE